ncbi:MAG TPA: tripartite tricarboxylate transporter substrate-binding protein [Burkholderiales bacterium]|nr:tripartite tricarboxylate transporter substrate-binding protein [Burkholderiales bacterium]
MSTAKRSSILPEVPTNEEAGFPNSDYTFWNGMLVAATPAEIVKRLHDETMKVLGQPGVVEKLKRQGLEPMPLAPAQFDALIAKEIETNKAIVKAAGL